MFKGKKEEKDRSLLWKWREDKIKVIERSGVIGGGIIVTMILLEKTIIKAKKFKKYYDTWENLY